MVVKLAIWAILGLAACPFHGGKYGEYHYEAGIAEIFRRPEPKAEEKAAEAEKPEKEEPVQPIYGPPEVQT